TAHYDGNTNLNASDSASLNQSVGGAPTTTSLAVDQASPVPGQVVQFTIKVKSTVPIGTPPNGTVDLRDSNGDTVGFGTLSSDPADPTNASRVSFSLSLLEGNHSLTAYYTNSAAAFAPSNSTPPLDIIVSKVATTTILTSDATDSVAAPGQDVAFTATVTGNTSTVDPPTGLVSIIDADTGKTIVQGRALAPADDGKQATATFSLTELKLTGGLHHLTAKYSSTSNIFASSSSAPPLGITVQAGSTTTLTSSLNPSAPGQKVTFTATVTVTGSLATQPTGTVTFKDGDTPIGDPVALTGTGSPTASLDTTTLTTTDHTITATYTPDGNYAASNASLTQHVTNPTATLTLKADPGTGGTTTTLTA
ncbi:Ig-like domain repeat protein, partial [Kitasatospora sp. MBT63]|uniref:Ig-like domain repeat protein n=1 Tax=Kitasatospora sp. MBT63 TaxID=1444768 RepID=UPI0018F28DF7